MDSASEHFSIKQTAFALAVIFALLLVLHAPLLTLPYFWDEAGHYVPAARDFLLSGDVIPTTTISNAHPPLPMIYLALWWKIFGYSIIVTRIAMLLVAAFALLQVYRLSLRLTAPEVAAAATIATALYPVIFAQSSLAHADLPAFALTLWGLRLYFDHPNFGNERLISEHSGNQRVANQRAQCIAVFALAALAKETAIVTPVALAVWEFMAATLGKRTSRGGSKAKFILKPLALLLTAVPLTLWYGYHFHRTGHVFGNPEFFRYNVGATMNPLRVLLAAAQRVWQSTGHMNLWLLTLATLAAMLLSPLPLNSKKTGVLLPGIAISAKQAFLAVILGHVTLHSLVGGAVLARYMMPVIPLVILLCIATLWQRVREWKWITAFACMAFVAGWVVNPPMRFSPEDNLNYRDFVALHQEAAQLLEKQFPRARVLTAWPANDELTKPYLGYVDRPLQVMRIENFTSGQVELARLSVNYDVALLFSTRYEPPRRWFQSLFWESANTRYFDYHRDLAPAVIADALGGTIIMEKHRNGQWVAVVEFPRIRNAVNHPALLLSK